MIEHSQEALEWAQEKFQAEYAGAHAIGIRYQGELVGAFIYWRFHIHQGRVIDLEMAFALDRPQSFTKGVRFVGMAYPFIQLRSERVTAKIAVDNHRSLRCARSVGFQKEGLIRRDSLPNEWLMGALKYEWERRWRR